MTASKRRVLLSHLAAEAADMAMKDDEMRIGCFRRVGCLITHHPSDEDNEIKPQGVTLKLLIPATYDNSDDNNFAEPSKQVAPEQELGGASNDARGDEEDSNANTNELCATGDEEELLSNEILEDVGVEESDEEE